VINIIIWIRDMECYNRSPYTFQKAMTSSLAPLLRKSVLVFFDDILVYSRTYLEHLVHLEQVFQLLQQE
jgi:hypothetical protein